MGSFGGVNFDEKNFKETVALAQQKGITLQVSTDVIEESIIEDNSNYPFLDGQYFVTSDFNTSLIKVENDLYNPKPTITPIIVKFFQKGDVVDIITVITNMSGNKVKAIKTSEGMFYADLNKISKTKPAEATNSESLSQTRIRNENKTKIIIIGAFILGYLLSNKE
jgi:hypothetical protein